MQELTDHLFHSKDMENYDTIAICAGGVDKRFKEFIIFTNREQYEEELNEFHEDAEEDPVILTRIENEIMKYSKQQVRKMFMRKNDPKYQKKYQDWCDDVVLYLGIKHMLFGEPIPIRHPDDNEAIKKNSKNPI